MEYGELKDLIHEYNPTVRSNRSAYKDQKGKDLNDVYEQYMNDIDDIWDQADAAEDDVTWASMRFFRRPSHQAGRQQLPGCRYGKDPV